MPNNWTEKVLNSKVYSALPNYQTWNDTWKLNAEWLILWLIWPMGAFIKALWNIRSHYAKATFLLFFIYFGFVLIVPDDVAGVADAARYARWLKEMNLNSLPLATLVSSIYNPDGGYVDIYQPLVTWIVSRFTGNPHYLFAIYAAVFGYFYVSNLWIILEKILVSIKPIILIYIVAFVLVNPIWNINGARMWTAAQVFVFGLLQYFILDNKKGMIWCFVAPFIHFSFFLPLAMFIGYLFLPNSITIFFAFYVGASLLKEINLSIIGHFLDYIPNIFQAKVQSYATAGYQQAVATHALQYAWHVRLAALLSKWLIYFWVSIIYWYRDKWFYFLPQAKTLFTFALYMGGWAQIAGLIPSGGRFISIANVLFYAVIILIMMQSISRNKIIYIAQFTLLPLLFVVIFLIRTGFDYMGILTITGNPLIAIFYGKQIPLIDFVKAFF